MSSEEIRNQRYIVIIVFVAAFKLYDWQKKTRNGPKFFKFQEIKSKERVQIFQWIIIYPYAIYQL